MEMIESKLIQAWSSAVIGSFTGRYMHRVRGPLFEGHAKGHGDWPQAS